MYNYPYICKRTIKIWKALGRNNRRAFNSSLVITGETRLRHGSLQKGKAGRQAGSSSDEEEQEGTSRDSPGGSESRNVLHVLAAQASLVEGQALEQFTISLSTVSHWPLDKRRHVAATVMATAALEACPMPVPLRPPALCPPHICHRRRGTCSSHHHP